MKGRHPVAHFGGRTPDRIAADQLLDRAQLLDAAGKSEQASELRRRASKLIGVIASSNGRKDVTGARPAP
jgi:hypothetical protein